MEIKLKLKSVAYGGKSVGEDIRVEIEVLENKFTEEGRIKRGLTADINKEIATFQVDQLLPIQIKITETDRLFDDVGKTTETLRIDSSKPFPQQFEYEVKVQERRLVFWKRTAIFTIIIEAENNARNKIGRVVLYSDVIPKTDSANLRAEPNDQSKILVAIPNKATVMIVRTAVSGNIPVGFLSDLWHEVSFEDATGFVHSSLVEIEGQEREKIIEIIRTKSKELGIDEKLALNLAHCESKWLPFAHSFTDNKGIYQLGADTIIDINQKYDGNVIDPWNPDQNIDGGLRYFKNLLSRYAGTSDALIRTLVAWNVGPRKVPTDGQFNLREYTLKVQDFVHCVLEEKRGEKTRLGLLLTILLWIIIMGGLILFDSDSLKNHNQEEKYWAAMVNRENVYLTRNKNFVLPSPVEVRERAGFVSYLRADLNGDGKPEKIKFAFYSPEPFVYETFIYPPNGEKIVVSGSLWKAFTDDLTGDGIKEVVIQTITGQLGTVNIFAYQGGLLKRIPVYAKAEVELLPATLATTNEVLFEDLQGDSAKEIVMPTRNYRDELIEPTYYYRWNGQAFILYDQKDIVYPPSNG